MPLLRALLCLALFLAILSALIAWACCAVGGAYDELIDDLPDHVPEGHAADISPPLCREMREVHAGADRREGGAL